MAILSQSSTSHNVKLKFATRFHTCTGGADARGGRDCERKLGGLGGPSVLNHLSIRESRSCNVLTRRPITALCP